MKKWLFCLWAALQTMEGFTQTIPDTLPDGRLAQVVVTAQFTPTEARQSVNSVRVLNRQAIERRAATSLGELLQAEPNMRISQDPLLGSALSINGLKGENLKILVDGVPVVGRLNGSIDAGQLPLNAVQQVEIIEGAQSLLYGSEASAGVINLITRKSQPHRFEAEANGQMESSGFQQYTGRAGARLGDFHLQVNGLYSTFAPPEDTALGRDQLWNPKRQQSGRAMLRYAPSKKLDLRLSGGLFEEQVDNLGDLRRPQYKPYSFDDYYNTLRSEATLQAEGWARKQWYWQATAGLNRFDRIKNTYRYDFETGNKSLTEGEGQQDTSAAEGWLVRATLASKFDRPLNFLIGLENNTEFAKGYRIVDSTANRPGFAQGNDLGLFGSLRFAPNRQFTLQGGARYTHNLRYGSALTPTVWMLWQPAGDWQVRFSYANGFRSPGLKELYFNFIDVNHFLVGNTDLKPEKSHNLRAELNWKLQTNRDVNVGVRWSGFYNHVRQRIVLAEFAPVQYRYVNLEKWQTLGAGLGIQAGISDWIQFRSEVVCTGFYNEFSGDSLRQFNWSADWVNDLCLSLIKDRLQVNVWHKLTGRTPYFFEDDKEVLQGESAAWHLLNVSAGGQLFDRRLRLNAGVKNLLGVRQIRSGATELGHNTGDQSVPVHWGRTYFVSLSVMGFVK
ncbi:MAG: TonB-dependent receptor [Saprospiraceae bacterium]|nr:TonB-dependent receptor [Saprospiraceae bacterium]